MSTLRCLNQKLQRLSTVWSHTILNEIEAEATAAGALKFL